MRALPPAERMRALFLVQGEGRGHTTQALALADALRARGHEVAAAAVGTSARRPRPAFLRRHLGAPVETFPSPSFAAGADGQIHLGATALAALRHLPLLGDALDRLDAVAARVEPDVVVSFYEPTAGVWRALRSPGVPLVAVAHQFMVEAPDYPAAPGQAGQRAAMRAFTRLAGWGADACLALSLYPAVDPSPRHRTTPPLLRRALFERRGLAGDGSLLVYLMEPSRAGELARWSDRHPDVRVHCFSDAPPHAHSPALTFHAPHPTRFLDHMARARGVVCTAGFESVSEAMWLGTPALMVPTPNHYEQRCNALDAERAGAGLAAEGLALSAFLDFLDAARPDPAPFRAWVAQAEAAAVSTLEAVAGLRRASARLAA